MVASSALRFGGWKKSARAIAAAVATKHGTKNNPRKSVPLSLVNISFWEETLRVFEPQTPRFACRCSRDRVAGMLRGLGAEEVMSLIAERGEAEVGCDFCGAMYRFDPVDAAQVFLQPASQPPGSPGVH